MKEYIFKKINQPNMTITIMALNGTDAFYLLKDEVRDFNSWKLASK